VTHKPSLAENQLLTERTAEVGGDDWLAQFEGTIADLDSRQKSKEMEVVAKLQGEIFANLEREVNKAMVETKKKPRKIH